MRFISIVLFSIVFSRTLAQTQSDQFIEVYNDFKNAKNMTFNASFSVFGKRAVGMNNLEGRFLLQKKKFELVKFKCMANYEAVIVGLTHFEEVTFDGINYRSIAFDIAPNYDSGVYENKGKLKVVHEGKIRTRTSAFIYSDLASWFQEFEKNKNKIVYNAEPSGYSFKIPSNQDRGEMIMYFGDESKFPVKVIVYDQHDNLNDYKKLTLSSIRTNLEFPKDFFRIPNSTGAEYNDTVSSLPLDTLKATVGTKLLEVGSLSPKWELANSDGEKRKLNDYKNKIVVMDFWATWCAPCVMAQPFLQKIHEKYNKDVVVLGMDYNDKAGVDINAYKIRKKLDYEMILNSEKIGNVYKINVLPTVYVIDVTGKIIYAAVGYSEKLEAELTSVIEGELKKSK